MDSYEITSLWRRTLGSEQNQTLHQQAVEDLRSQYKKFRKNVSALVGLIGKDLPELTVHDITHLDALWETADLIIGAEYPINPLEAFVLGGAILLHDSALTFEAYKGGRSGVRESSVWADSYALAQKRGADSDDARAEADFNALRHLHAKQAALLGVKSWTSPEGEEMHLIEDDNLRKHFGEIIGRIAATHHINAYDLEDNLPTQINSPASLPREWRIDPVKIACILRCADAAHIDERRAPDFLRTLLKRKGVSFNHWTAQNWLCRADVDLNSSGGENLIITSAKAFPKESADSWWVAFDSIQLISRELGQSNHVLARRKLLETSPPFQIKKVTGAASPSDAAQIIHVDGWKPTEVKVHISDVEGLVSKLGGSQLYDDDEAFIIIIRELVQNSYDAIKARRVLQSGFSGTISIRLHKVDGTWILTVEDDGIGMSLRTLTGPLLDFGTSFWSSFELLKEWPGLAAEKFDCSGQFGIGFYSIFMLADAVLVSSRRWDKARDSTVNLEFPNGLSMRPIVAEIGEGGLDPEISTQVEVILNDRLENPLETHLGHDSQTGDPVSGHIGRLFPQLLAGVDCRAEFSSEDYNFTHDPMSKSDPARCLTWLASLDPTNETGDTAFYAAVKDRLRHIGPAEELKGFAALFPESHAKLGVSTIGGLSTDSYDNGQFAGFIDYQPATASRSYGSETKATWTELEAWLFEQYSILRDSNLDEADWVGVMESAASLGFVHTQATMFLVSHNGKAEYFDSLKLRSALKSKGVAIMQNPNSMGVAPYPENDSYKDLPTLIYRGSREFYHLYPENMSLKRKVMLDYFREAAREEACQLDVELIKGGAPGKVGPIDVGIYRALPL